MFYRIWLGYWVVWTAGPRSACAGIMFGATLWSDLPSHGLMGMWGKLGSIGISWLLFFSPEVYNCT